MKTEDFVSVKKIDSELNMTDMKRRYVSIMEVSVYTSIPVKTLYEWASIGKIPSIKAGSRVLFDLQDVDMFMESLKRPCNQSETVANKIIGDIHGNSI